jgi:hypothetical protein
MPVTEAVIIAVPVTVAVLPAFVFPPFTPLMALVAVPSAAVPIVVVIARRGH